jgi:quercetin dioxygenase-like cupin family protein
MSLFKVMAAALLAFTVYGGRAVAEDQPIIASPADLKWVDVPSLPPGAKVAVIEGPMNVAGQFTARLMFPANYQIPPHTHPAIEHVTVLSGAVNMGHGNMFDRSKTTEVGPGGIAIMPVGMPHFVWTKTETVIQLHGVGPWTIDYVNPADDPRKK